MPGWLSWKSMWHLVSRSWVQAHVGGRYHFRTTKHKPDNDILFKSLRTFRVPLYLHLCPPAVFLPLKTTVVPWTYPAFSFFKGFIYSWKRGRGRSRLPAGARCGTQSLDPGITPWAEGRCSTTGPPRRPNIPCSFPSQCRDHRSLPMGDVLWL